MTKTAPQPAHRLALRIYYEDTDAGGIVYHANYLKFAERARTEMIRELGVENRAWREQAGLSFVVQRCAITFHRPARLDDEIEVRTTVDRVGAASLSLRQDIYRGETLLASMDVRLALIDDRMKPARFPKILIAALGPQYGVGK